ncbi:OmpA family protein [uncultured Maribacter sp.]|uniref:OmpA family protein n=1 Tax=uncultured Maribacter sp. TaxID=431308 RepID=UPI00261E52C4|nr:OmpA family protein [uncultured Maribacter sp.]
MKIIFSIILSLATLLGFSQERSICPDVEGAINHPLIEKYNNSCIVAYTESKFNSVTFPISKINSNQGAPKEITEEGKVVNIIYGIENSSRATTLEVQKNYELALKHGGFEIIYSAFGRKNISGSYRIQNAYKSLADVSYITEYQYQKPKSYFKFAMTHHNSNIDSDDAFFVAKGKKDGKMYTLALFIHYNRSSWEGLKDNIFVMTQIVEQEDMETGQVSAASIEEKIKNEGKEVFHNILFDFGSADLTLESYAIIETLSTYLKANPNQKYYIVGHTDNVGALPTNQTLSEKRALAVLETLTSKYGVKKDQISAHGVGQLSPLAINSTEEGRALNRRVEVVLK